MKGTLPQWAVLVATGIAFWLMGESRIHVLAFAWFTVALAALAAAVTTALLFLERRRLERE